MELRTKARRLQAEHGLDLLIVDYLQLMQATTTSRDANRVQEVSEISRGLKAPGPRAEGPGPGPLPAVAPAGDARVDASRASRTCASRAPSSRTRTWSSSCGARRTSAGEESDVSDGEVINLHLAKHRNGPTGELKLWFKKSQTRFVSYAGERYAEAV